MTKWVYSFGNGAAEGAADMRNLLGGKGANLAEMSSLGLPVPPGFTITTEVCTKWYADGVDATVEAIKPQVEDAMKKVEDMMGAKFGDKENPLLMSVRSGARVSMPGMMDTVLNIGLNDETARGMVALTGDERFVYDAYRRLVQMFGSVVMGIPDEAFESVLLAARSRAGSGAIGWHAETIA